MVLAPLNPIRTTETVYPESDGKPMADNTKQFDYIVTIKENIGILYKDDPNVFIAGDLFWYPVEGNNKLCLAPDVLVAFGRPKGYRGSYLQWQEDNIAPQIVFEILSPSNKKAEMDKKFAFYERYEVEEYYLYDPDKGQLKGWLYQDKGLTKIIEPMSGWISPRLNVRFELVGLDLRLFYPDGRPFLTVLELEEARQQAETARWQAEADRRQAEADRRQAEEARQEAEKRADVAETNLAQVVAQLRALGVEPKLD